MSKQQAQVSGSVPTTSKLVRKTESAPRTVARNQPSREALQCLEHERALYAYALKLSRNPDDAKDLVQETLLRAMQAWESFEDGTNRRAWLYRILTNAFINGYRKRRRHHQLAEARPLDALHGLYGRTEDHVPHAAEAADDNELSSEVAGALEHLGPEYREVIERADLRGEKYRDIASALDVPIGTVMSRLFRARRALERKLAGFAREQYGFGRALVPA